MARTFQDQNFLIWEAFPSTGPFGYPDAAYIVFNCLSNKTIRPRYIELKAAEPAAQKELQTIGDAALLKLFETARPLG